MQNRRTRAGEAFYEPPGPIHDIGESASDVRAARALPIIVAQGGQIMRDTRFRITALTGLRLALGLTFLCEVASRLGLLGRYGGNWTRFVQYAGEVNWYLPTGMIPSVAVAATFFEIVFGVALVAEWQVRKVAAGSAGLLTVFALAMFSGDPRSPFDYSVFTAAFGALTLAAVWDDRETRKETR